MSSASFHVRRYLAAVAIIGGLCRPHGLEELRRLNRRSIKAATGALPLPASGTSCTALELMVTCLPAGFRLRSRLPPRALPTSHEPDPLTASVLMCEADGAAFKACAHFMLQAGELATKAASNPQGAPKKEDRTIDLSRKRHVHMTSEQAL